MHQMFIIYILFIFGQCNEQINIQKFLFYVKKCITKKPVDVLDNQKNQVYINFVSTFLITVYA